MNTKNQIELTPSVAARRNLTTRTAVASLALTAAAIPAIAGDRSVPVTKEVSIRPFHVNIPEAELTELRRRINATKWPERELVTDASQGVQLATMQKLARYWASDYDWRKC